MTNPLPRLEPTRGWRRWLIAARLSAVLMVCGLLTWPSAGQVRAVAIQDATILTGTGQRIDHGSLMFQEGKIVAVGKKVPATFLTRKLPGAAKFITPGFIDAYGMTGLRYDPDPGRATASAVDAFDRYGEDEMRAAHRVGVTAAFLPARVANGFGGLGVVVRLKPGGSHEDVVLRDEAGLCAAVGLSGNEGPLARVKTAEELRGRFKAAREYRESWEDYEDSLKEYEEKLVERAKKQASESKGKDKPTSKNLTAAGGDKPRKPEKKEGGEDKKDKDKKDELKKPAEPNKDREAEMLLRVLDGELRLRVETHAPADILNVLDLADEYGLALILDGAGGAHLVADRLAEREVPVVLSAPPMPLGFVSDQWRYARPDAAATLQRAGVDVLLGSGAAAGSPNLLTRLALAVGHGLDGGRGVEMLTSKPARLLGVEKEIGELAAGLAADFVVWSDHPLAAGARVEQVYLGGFVVYSAEGDE